MESLGNGSTRPLETNSENTSPRLQLANHDASGGRGVQREPTYVDFLAEHAYVDLLADEQRKPKLNRRFRSATADVVALEVGVDIAADS